MLNKINLTKLLRYLAQAIAIYLIFKYIPTQQMNNIDIVLITIIITLICILLENVSTNTNKEQICSSVCSIKKPVENFSTLSCSNINQTCSTTQSCCNTDVSMTCVHNNANGNQPTDVGTCKPNTLVNNLNTNASDKYGYTPLSTSLSDTLVNNLNTNASDNHDYTPSSTSLSDTLVDNLNTNASDKYDYTPLSTSLSTPLPTHSVSTQPLTFSLSSNLTAADVINIIQQYNKTMDNVQTNKNINDSESSYSSISEKEYPATMYTTPQNKQIERFGSRMTDGVNKTDMPYNDYNHLPISQNYVSSSTDYGYSFLPPEKWYPQPPNPPICVTEKQCPVCPIYTQGSDLNLKDWYESKRVTPPDNINTAYIKEVLNAGK